MQVGAKRAKTVHAIFQLSFHFCMPLLVVGQEEELFIQDVFGVDGRGERIPLKKNCSIPL